MRKPQTTTQTMHIGPNATRQRRLARRPHGRSSAGFTLIEVLVTASVLLIGLLAMTSTSVVVNSLRKSASDQQIAQASLQAIVEDLHATAREADNDPLNWTAEIVNIYGAGGVPGNAFPVNGLDPWAGQANVATVQIITDETVTDAALGAAAGMPRDLNSDGAASSGDVTASASLLPVVIRMQWTGSAGQQQLSQVIYLLRY